MQTPTVTLSMIVRNEQDRLPAAVGSVRGLVDEIIVVDTGSTDDTCALARDLGARVIEVPWRDDFAAARNCGLDQVTTDWVLMLDADETLAPVDPAAFAALLQRPDVCGYELTIDNPRGGGTVQSFTAVRLYRADPQIRYCFPFHEQIIPALNRWAAAHGQAIAASELRIEHTGYLPEIRQAKQARNLRVLTRAVDAHPDEPYLWYQLGSEQVFLLDDEIIPVAGLGEALGRLETALRLTSKFTAAEPEQAPWLPDLVAKIASAHLALEQPGRACELLTEQRRRLPEHPLLLFQSVLSTVRELTGRRIATPTATAAAPAEIRQRRLDRAQQDLQRLAELPLAGYQIALSPRLHDVYPLRLRGELALVAGDPELAERRFNEAAAAATDYSAPWVGLAACRRLAGDPAGALRCLIEAVRISEWNWRAWADGVELLQELGQTDQACRWQAKLAEHFPELPAG